MLRDVPAISCTLDCWTSLFNQAFLSVTGHWICEKTWTVQEILLGFENLDGPHTSENLASAFITLLDNLGLGAKLFTITTNNASNMEKMADLIEAHSEQDNTWQVLMRSMLMVHDTDKFDMIQDFQSNSSYSLCWPCH